MTHDLLLGIVKFTIRADEVTYKMPHKIEQYSSLSDMEKEHTKSIYFRNEKDKRRGVDYSLTCVNFLRWYDPLMCQRSVQIIPGLLRSCNKLEEILAMVEEKRRKLLKFLIIG
ncbi:hypothetical protein Tco_0077588 [Tanacetum coccineum]